MDFDEFEMQDAIVKSLKNMDISFEVAGDIAFHMTDWLQDLSQWEQFCKNPKSLSNIVNCPLTSMFHLNPTKGKE